MMVVDAMNVVGSRPTGWWRDRTAAMSGLVEQLARLDAPVTVVFDGRERAAVRARAAPHVTVVFAPDADEEIAAIVGRRAAGTPVTVVTSDRALRRRVSAAGAEVVGGGTFRRRLEES